MIRPRSRGQWIFAQRLPKSWQIARCPGDGAESGPCAGAAAYSGCVSTTRKLWLGFGLLLVLLVGSGLFVARRLSLVERALVTIMAVQEPANAATYEMAVNVSSTGSAVLVYADTGSPETRARVDSLLHTFDQLKRDYDLIARSRASRQLGSDIAWSHRIFSTLGDSLMKLSDQRRHESDEFGRASDAIARVIERDLTPGPGVKGRDAQKRALLASQLDADVSAMGAAVGHYMRTLDSRYRAPITDHETHFRVTLQQFRELHMDEAVPLAERAGRAFEEFVLQGRQVLDRVNELHDTETRFTKRGAAVERLVSEGIHSLARTDLVEAQQSARRALHTSLIAVLVLLVAGIVIGSATALPTGRSIVRAEVRIRDQAEQLQLRMDDLALAHQRKDEFLGVLGHELRNPLAPLSNALHVLTAHDARLPSEVRDAHDMMRRQVRNMTRLVDDLLDVSRISEGKITLRREAVDLGAVSADVAEDLRPAADARRHRLERAAPPHGPWVHADPTRLAQIVSNLLLNAVKYTPEGGVIRVEVDSKNGEALLRVRDNGVGIAPEMRSRIFDPFVQGDAAAPQQGGLGIGLTLVRRLVELHEGRIEVASPGPGRGSTFTVRLPALERPPVAPPPAASRTPAPRRRVLVVDDNRDAAETLAALLELWGHRVRVVHDGPAALEATALDPPEIVLLDIGLPGMDGYAVAARLREQAATRTARIVALTGFGQETDRHTALTAGFDDHMTKPVNPEALRDLLGRSRV